MSKNERRSSLLIVDDEVNFRESLKITLEDTFDIILAGSLVMAREELTVRVPDAILLDIRLPDGEGVELLRELKCCLPPPVVVIMTAHATVESAVKSLKEGAVDYFVKPFDISKLKRELAVYLENRFLHKRIDSLDRELKKISSSFVTEGKGKMREIIDRGQQIAPIDIPVLITGETGTGKEKLANWIHSLSERKGEIVAINCAALPKDILESELFGYAKGAFSGAIAMKEGLVEKADGGTLFLDEIGELPETAQAKFLRILEDGVYYKLGETRERRVSFRLISATNGDLADPTSSFRRDLFYRVSGITFKLPPLRERRDDIPLLVPIFIREANYTYKKEVKGVSVKTMQYLISCDWPGNIRELKWCIYRGVATAVGDILNQDDLSLPIPAESMKDCPDGKVIDYNVPFEEAVEQLEKKYISHALQAFNTKTEAARGLGISVRVLHYKIKKYGF